MASTKKHISFGLIFLGVVLVLILLFLGRDRILLFIDFFKNNQVHVIISFFLFLIGSVAPDLLEPARFWNHRAFFHSKILLFFILALLIFFILMIVYYKEILLMYVISFFVGYILHLSLDLKTRRGLS